MHASSRFLKPACDFNNATLNLILECGEDSMSLEQMNRLGLLQQDPPIINSGIVLPNTLQIRIPSPSVSPAHSVGSTGYPSPTPSLPGNSQSISDSTPSHFLLPPFHRVDNSNMHLYTNNVMPNTIGVQDNKFYHRDMNTAKVWRPW